MYSCIIAPKVYQRGGNHMNILNLSRGKQFIIFGVIIAIVVAVVAYFTIRGRNTGPQTVKVATVVKGDLDLYLYTNATITSKKYQEYPGAASLVVKSVNVNVGDNVKKGQVMLQYDLSDLNTNIQKAQASYDSANADLAVLLKRKSDIEQLEAAKKNVNPTDTATIVAINLQLAALPAVTQQQIQQAQANVDSAKVDLDASNEQLEKYKNGIVADFNGTVTQLNASSGYVVASSQPAIVVQQLNNLKAVALLSQSDGAKVNKGQAVVLKYAGKSYKGIVASVTPATDQSNSATSGQEGVLQVDVNINENASELRVDFLVSMDVLIGVASDVMKIPSTCIRYDSNKNPYVFKVQDGKAKLTSVEIGRKSVNEYEITKGLAVGDILIISPTTSIKNGVEVNIGAK